MSEVKTIPKIYTIECFEPGLLWYEYAQAVGPKELQSSFGWSVPPLTARALERVWRVFSPERPRWHVGWFSLRTDPTDSRIVYLVRGVLPDARRLGYRVALGEEAARLAAATGARYLTIEILTTNPEHFERIHKESQTGGPWRRAGVIWEPKPLKSLYVRDLVKFPSR